MTLTQTAYTISAAALHPAPAQLRPTVRDLRLSTALYDSDLAGLLAGRPLHLLSAAEVEALQNNLDRQNMAKLKEYLQSGQINSYDFDYLQRYYSKGMKVYRQFYDTLCHAWGQTPRVFYRNIDTGQIDRRPQYTFHHIAPFTSMALEFRDCNGHRVLVTLGKMKSLERVVEKISPGSRYHQDYQAARSRIINRFGGNLSDRQCQEQLKALQRPVEKINDILRCLTICNNFEDIRGTYDKFDRDPLTQVMAVKDKYKGNLLPADMPGRLAFSDNPRNHRDFKFIGMFGHGFKAEYMAMTAVYERYYKRTHKDYEHFRRLEQELVRLRREPLTGRDKYIALKKKELRLFQIKQRIRQTSGKGFARENLRVLQEVAVLEKKFRLRGVAPEADGTYPQCVDFLNRNFYVRTVQALDRQSFSNLKPPLSDVAARYRPVIKSKYLADISGLEAASPLRKRPQTEIDADFLAADDSEHQILLAIDKAPFRLHKQLAKSEQKVNNIPKVLELKVQQR